MTRFLDLPSWFARLPQGQAAIAEAQQADRTEFQRLAAELDALNAQEESEAKTRAAATKKAEGEFEKARSGFDAAKKRLGELRAASLGASAAFDGKRSAIQGKMQLLGGELVSQFIDELRAEHARLRRPESVQSVEVLTTDRTDGLPMRIDVSNATSVGARLTAIVKAIRAAESLRYSTGDVAGELAKLRASLPAVKSAAEESQGVLAAAASKVGRTIRTAHDRMAARLMAYAEREAQTAQEAS